MKSDARQVAQGCKVVPLTLMRGDSGLTLRSSALAFRAHIAQRASSFLFNRFIFYKTAKQMVKEKCQYESWVNEYFGLPENFPERAVSTSFDYGQIVNMLAMFDAKRNEFHKRNLNDCMAELDLENARLKEQLKQERNKVLSLINKHQKLPDTDTSGFYALEKLKEELTAHGEH